MKIWKTALITFAVLFLGVVGYYAYSIFDFFTPEDEEQLLHPPSAVDQPGGSAIQPEKVEYEPPKWEGKERVNILLLGVDSRDATGNSLPRSDTMLVASIDPVSKQAHLFSLLRDTYVNIPGKGEHKLNSAVVYGGPKLAMQTVSELTGLDIQYYVYTDFEGFVHLIDEIGGIEFYVEKDMKYTSKADGPEYDINLKEGLQHLDGKTALQYVRFRRDALSDYARTERQRKFLTAVAEKTLTFSSLMNLPNILKAVDPYVHTNLTPAEVVKLGWLGLDVRKKEVIGVQLPPSNLLREETIGGESVLTINPARLKKYIQEQFEKAAEPQTVDPKDAAMNDAALPSGNQS